MNTSTTTCETSGSSTICTTETAEYFTNGFSFGDVMIIFMLILILTTIFFNFLKNWVIGQKIENQIRPDYNKDI